MKKTTDDELNQWRYQYPGTAVSWTLTGDPAYCQQFVGEAKRLLYSVKNRMKLGGLKSFWDIWPYSDGTIITVRSVFGQDFIEIIARGGGVFPSCSIKLLNVPSVVPPMMWYYPWKEIFTKVGDAWEIRKPNGDLEVEGIDFIKTYYSYSTIDCSGLPDFTIGEESWNSEKYHPFYYKSENDDGSLIYNYQGAMVPHWMGSDWSDPPRPANPLRHSIHSYWGCGAEIIKFDKDKKGTYFLWKAYTEWSNISNYLVNFTRTGLGYMLMQGFINNGTDRLCESEGIIIKVDCCVKPEVERQVKLWWEHGSGPFMFYGEMKLYEVPDVVLLWALYYYACTPGGMQFYTFPEISGSCIPMEWDVKGRGKVVVWPHPVDNIAGYLCPTAEEYGPTGCSDVTITVKDRCGTEDKVLFTCCDYPGKDEISIYYTSLSMACGYDQELIAGGGCPPYTWTFSGNGSLELLEYRQPGNDIVIYTAPPDNPNCGNNDTVTLTDCCGNKTTISIHVSCYNAGLYSMIWTEWLFCYCFEFAKPACAGMPVQCSYCIWVRKWDCLGVLTYDVTTGEGCPPNDCIAIPPPPPCVNYCTCWEVDDSVCKEYWYPRSCTGCETLVDVRTDDMKEAGCCPINPFTGAPYSP